MNAIRKLLGGTFGSVVLVVGTLLLTLGVVGLVLGIYVLAFGEFHGRWSAIFYLPTGALFAFIGYGATRLGWETLRSTAKQTAHPVQGANDAT